MQYQQRSGNSGRVGDEGCNETSAEVLVKEVLLGQSDGRSNTRPGGTFQMPAASLAYSKSSKLRPSSRCNLHRGASRRNLRGWMVVLPVWVSRSAASLISGAALDDSSVGFSTIFVRLLQRVCCTACRGTRTARSKQCSSTSSMSGTLLFGWMQKPTADCGLRQQRSSIRDRKKKKTDECRPDDLLRALHWVKESQPHRE